MRRSRASRSRPPPARLLDEDAQIRALQQQIQELSKQVDALSREARERKEREAQTVAGAPKPPAATKEAPAESKFDKFIKGFYGTLDVSLDDTTKGLGDMTAFSWGYANPLDPTSGIVRGGQKAARSDASVTSPRFPATGPMSAIAARTRSATPTSTSSSRCQPRSIMAAAPGLNKTWTKSSNTVTGAIGLGDTFIGFKNKDWGTLKFGTMYAPLQDLD